MAHEKLLHTLRGNLANLEEERADTMRRLAALDAEQGIIESNIARYSGDKTFQQPAPARATANTGKAVSSEQALSQIEIEEAAFAAEIVAVWRQHS